MSRRNRTWSKKLMAALLASRLAMGVMPMPIQAAPEPSSVAAPVSFVLDQGLPLELSFEDIFGTDGALADLQVQILGLADESQTPGDDPEAIELLDGWSITNASGYQGDIQVWPQARGKESFLRYTPTAFLSSRDQLHILLQIPGTDGQTTLVKTLTFLPGNVVYYEEDYPAIELIGGSIRTTQEDGRFQSPDQSLPHGYDPAYATAEDVSMSGGSLASIPITPPPNGQYYQPQPAVRFTFTGTGFELITMTDSLFATALLVEISQQKEDGQSELIQEYPLISSYSERLGSSGSGVMIYQIPLIRTWGLDYGTYTVQISGVPLITGHDEDDGPVYGPTTYVYVDGIRIFQPLQDATAQEYGNEFGAQFTGPQTLTLDGKAAILGLPDDPKTQVGLSGLTGSGVTFQEDTGRNWFQSGRDSDMECLNSDNEIYLGDTAEGNALTFYVAEEEAGKGMLQIGLKDMHEDLYRGLHGSENQRTAFHYLLADGSWSQKVQLGLCGTEQYHTIDYHACPTVEYMGRTYHQILLRVPDGMVSLTAVKSAGLAFGDLFASRGQDRYRYDGYGLYQADRFAEDGSVLPESQATWQGAPQDPQCLYRTEAGVLSYAWRYDPQGRELSEEELIWITNSVMPGYYYKLKDGMLYQAARFDPYGNELNAEDLQWETVDCPITDSLFRSGAALTTAAEAERQQPVPEEPIIPEEPRPGNWWQRFITWMKELFRIIFSRI